MRNLTHNEINELRAVNHGDWSDPADKNELQNVAARKKVDLQDEPSDWEPPILWGHARSGPFTIIEGNHRLTAYFATGRNDLDIPVFVGMSPLKCHWHRPDECGLLMQDLIAR